MRSPKRPVADYVDVGRGVLDIEQANADAERSAVGRCALVAVVGLLRLIAWLWRWFRLLAELWRWRWLLVELWRSVTPYLAAHEGLQ